jgi:pimeloyl-ACP methyl ester carboxylesterase
MERDMKAFGRFSSGHTYLYNPNLPSRLPNILARTLVLAAEVDEIIPRQHSEAYARLIPEAVLRDVPRTAHVMHNEQPQVVAHEVIEFLAPSVKPRRFDGSGGHRSALAAERGSSGVDCREEPAVPDP